MDTNHEVRIEINPKLSPEQLFLFYEKNNICEKNYGQKTAARVLKHSDLIIAALVDDELVGLARAMFDGLDAVIMEFSLGLEYQGKDLLYENGSLLQQDAFGVGERLGKTLLEELSRMGACFIETYAVENLEEPFLESLGFKHNVGHLVYIIDERPYLKRDS